MEEDNICHEVVWWTDQDNASCFRQNEILYTVYCAIVDVPGETRCLLFIKSMIKPVSPNLRRYICTHCTEPRLRQRSGSPPNNLRARKWNTQIRFLRRIRLNSSWCLQYTFTYRTRAQAPNHHTHLLTKEYSSFRASRRLPFGTFLQAVGPTLRRWTERASRT